jgi:PAS domain S-box-containing protein
MKFPVHRLIWMMNEMIVQSEVIMPIPLAVLIVEDAESDVQLLVRLLKRADYELVYEQVETAEQMCAALEKQTWDIVISDYRMPQFDGRTALKLLQDTGHDIPFIVVSGTIGEETAVAMMKAGAHDYLIKGDLARLVPAVQRELVQSKIRRGRKQMEEALREHENRLQSIFRAAPTGIGVVRDKILQEVNQRICEMTGYMQEELIGKSIRIFYPTQEEYEYAEWKKDHLIAETGTGTVETRWQKKNGPIMDILLSSTPMDPSDLSKGLTFTALNITERKQVEKSLVESEIKFRWLYEYAPVAYHLLMPDGSITDVNRRWCELLGYHREEAIGKSIFDFVVGEEKDEARASFERKKLSKQLFVEGSERNFLTKDGVVRIFKTYDFFVLDQGQNITSVQTTIEDITERVRAEEALRESEDRYRTLVEFSPDSIGIHREGRMVYVNAAAVKLFHGNRVEDLIGMPVVQFVHPDYQSIAMERIQRGYENRQPASLLREKFITLDGQSIDVEVTTTPIVYNGKAATQVIVRDISERMKAEAARAASEAEMRALVEQVPTTVYTESAETGETLYISPQVEKLTGYTPTEWIKDRNLWKQITHPEDLADLLEEDERTAITHEPFYTEYRILTRDGRMLWIHDEAAIIENQDGTPLFWQGVMYDITERKQTEEIMQTTNILLEQTLEQSPIPMVLVSMPDGIIRSVNSACLRFLGMEDEPSTIGMPLSELSPSYQDFDMQGNPAIVSDLPLPRSLRGLKTDPQERHIIRKDGTSVYGLVYGSPIFDTAGKLIAGYLVMTDITERKRAEEGINQRVTELEMLYQSGLALSQLLNPKEIGQKILELLEQKLGWHNTRIRLYHPQDDSLELLDFNQPGLKDEAERYEVVERYQSLITHSGQGMSGWVVQNGQPVLSGDVNNDPRYVEAYPGICSGLYVPMKLGERIVGVLSIESEQPDAFSVADERLMTTLANQAASAFENARLFEETRKRVMELETLNRISLILRAVSKQEEMLSIVLDEALAILNTSHGSIELYNKTTDSLAKTITRGWMAQLTESSRNNGEGIAGKVFSSGETYISREFATDLETRDEVRSQIPPKWGGICLPIRTTQQTLGVLIVSVPSGHELDKDEIRLLATLSEMTGSALQRMQLHEQTVRRLEQLHALRAVDQAISSSRDMRLTLNILLTHTISQLDVDAADVLLLQPGLNQLELAAAHGFHTHLFEGATLNNSIVWRAIVGHQTIMTLDFDTAALRENPQFGKLWKEEGFVCYWCVPLIIKGEVKGVLGVYRRKAFTPDAEWLDFLEALAGQAAITIDNTQLFENLQSANLDLSLAYDATIEGWSRAMDLRDHETEGHTLRVTDLTVNLARAMHISESQLTAIRRGALLHDIGKMGVPDAILLKEGDLTDEEWVIMRKHPEFAHDMLMPIAYLNDALDIPYCHHEKWDGTGYPRGLKGNHIPLVARIFAIVDVWDALTNDRTYRKKWTKQKARQFIKEQSGKHFDPQIVDVFLKNIEKKSRNV